MGNLIVIDHGCNVQTTFYPLASRSASSQGSACRAGEWIGTVGSTGRTTGTHYI